MNDQGDSGGNPFSPLLARQGVVISDGGMGTQLERVLGRALDPELWCVPS